jgi:3-deoxy-D-manno-octulosonic-acid transferase
MRYIYNFVFYLALPFILLRLLWKSRKLPAYKERILERFAYFKTPPIKDSIWLHAVSFGESIAATPLIKNLQAKYNLPIVVTNMTPTGYEYIDTTFADTIFHSYVPYDYSGAITRFLRHINPKLAVIMEAELWPNILHYCAKNKVPVILANARLSEHSFKGYKRIKKFSQNLLDDISVIATQSNLDTERFINLGAKSLVTIGNLKFDKTIPENIFTDAKQLRKKWGKNRLIWIAASTHAREEEKILAAYKIIKQNIKNSLLVLVLRHPERFAKVTELCQQQGYKVISHSKKDICSADTDIVIGDTMGELLLLYAASDVAFVGGSLVAKLKGHNTIEPTALGIPAITGPYVGNFIEVNQLLESEGALITVSNSNELASKVIELLQNESLRKEQAANGLKIVAENRGALQKLLKIIQDKLS